MGVAILRVKMGEGYGFGFALGAMATVLERPCREASARKRGPQPGQGWVQSRPEMRNDRSNEDFCMAGVDRTGVLGGRGGSTNSSTVDEERGWGYCRQSENKRKRDGGTQRSSVVSSVQLLMW